MLRDRTGNAVDFDTTFEQQYPPLVRYCHRLSGDRDTAEDIAQEAMLRLFEYEPFQIVQTMFPYAYTFWVHDWKEKTPKRRYR